MSIYTAMAETEYHANAAGLEAERPMRDKFFQMRVDDEFLRRLDDMRRLEQDIPSRTEMARRLLEATFDAKLGTKQKPRLKAL